MKAKSIVSVCEINLSQIYYFTAKGVYVSNRKGVKKVKAKAEKRFLK